MAAKGIFTTGADIGHPKNAGASSYDAGTQTYSLRGSGYNIWFNRDEFHYLSKKIGGDFILTADFAFVGDKGKRPGCSLNKATGSLPALVTQ